MTGYVLKQVAEIVVEGIQLRERLNVSVNETRSASAIHAVLEEILFGDWSQC